MEECGRGVREWKEVGEEMKRVGRGGTRGGEPTVEKERSGDEEEEVRVEEEGDGGVTG